MSDDILHSDPSANAENDSARPDPDLTDNFAVIQPENRELPRILTGANSSPKGREVEKVDAHELVPTKTGKKKPRGKPFVKGDPRINKKGRPRDIDTLKTFIQRIADESVGQGEHPEWTRLEVLIRYMFSSRSPEDRKQLLRYGYGEVPIMSGNLNVNIDWSKLSEEQLERIANGEDPRTVIFANPSAGHLGTGEAEEGEIIDSDDPV